MNKEIAESQLLEAQKQKIGMESGQDDLESLDNNQETEADKRLRNFLEEEQGSSDKNGYIEVREKHEGSIENEEVVDLKELIKASVQETVRAYGIEGADELISELTDKLAKELQEKFEIMTDKKNESTDNDKIYSDETLNLENSNSKKEISSNEVLDGQEEDGEMSKGNSIEQNSTLNKNLVEDKRVYNEKMLQMKLGDLQGDEEFNEAIRQMYIKKGLEVPGDDEDVTRSLLQSIENEDISWDDIDVLVSDKEKIVDKNSERLD